ncbi:MAG: M23 family metallopeptidase, partial [Burkholderiales bacterium]|nr:M23 family metallopeptidase [Burkholderiales bacterium]
LRRGDRFSIMYEALEADGDFVRSGRIIAAEFVNQGRVLRAVYFEDDSGRGSYFTPDGRNMRRAFLRSPLEFSRVTSGFTTARFHPILQTWRAHKGIDYGAPVGTPVRATADATVGLAGRQNGYGNVIVLRHANGIQTLYAHLSGFRRDLRTGSRVQQGELIGYVGMTGMATGPHLHYEFHINGVHVDPLRSAPQPGPAITAQMRPAFQTIAREQVERLEQIRELNLAALE